LAAPVLRIFVSSPSDVAAERERVRLVAERLNGELGSLAHLEVLRWEDAFYTAAHSFQEAIDAAIGNMSAADMVVCIVWKRAGLQLNPVIWRRPDGSAYESGTVLEVETAVSVARTHRGVPDVYLFRKTAPVLYHADRANEEMQQHQLLEAVWRRWTESAEGYNTAGYQTFADEDDFEAKLEACLRQWLERRGIVVRGPIWDRHVKGSPFCGLAPFDASHAPVFFGREATVGRAIGKLRKSPFLLIIGASGSGKSSLLRAGLIPRLTAPGVMPEVDQWRTAVLTPTDDPLVSLAEALFGDEALGPELRAGDFSTARLLAKLLAAGGDAALAPIRSALARAAKARMAALRYETARPVRLLIAADQLERLFVEADAAHAEAFARMLHDLVDADLASVIAVLRSDAYGRFQATASFLALLEKRGSTLDLLPPSPAELEDIVARPVAACHPPLAYEIDADGHTLAERLVADAKGGDALPLLQMTLQRLFDAEAARGDGLLRFRDYPGMDAAVTRTAEEAVAELDARALAALPALITAFVRDVSFDQTGRLESMSVVPVMRTAYERGDPVRTALVDQFIARRLLTAEDADGAVRVRPVHEALLRVLPQAVAIIKENAALIRVRSTLAPMAVEWSRAELGAKSEYLATSPALIAGAAQLNERHGEELAPELRAFIVASLEADARRREAERVRQRRIIGATAAGLVVALVLAGLAGWQWRVASRESQRANDALTAATNTADTLVFELAREFANRPGMPVELTRSILQKVQELQRQLARSGTTVRLRRTEAVSLIELADLFRAQGDRSTARTAVMRALEILDELLKRFPDSAQLRRDYAVALRSLGDIQFGDQQFAAALESFTQALAIIEKLVEQDSADVTLQRDLWLQHTKIADVYAIIGPPDKALAAYRKGLEIIAALAKTFPDNRELQADLAHNHSRIGMELRHAGQFQEALAAYRTALAIRQWLAEVESDNTRWQRDVFVTLLRIAEIFALIDQREESLATYRQALAIIAKLAASDRGNVLWQSELALTHERIGAQLALAGKTEPALDAYRTALRIRAALAAAHPDNIARQRDVALNHDRIADILLAANRNDEAHKELLAANPLIERYAGSDRDNTQWQIELVLNLVKLAHLGDDARARYTRAIDILRQLAAAGRLTAEQQKWIGQIEAAIAKLP
jgi:tetratricopeptide (TPR) repeat protein